MGFLKKDTLKLLIKPRINSNDYELINKIIGEYIKLDEYEKAQKFLEKMLNKTKDERLIAQIVDDIAYALNEQNKFKETQDLLNKYDKVLKEDKARCFLYEAFAFWYGYQAKHAIQNGQIKGKEELDLYIDKMLAYLEEIRRLDPQSDLIHHIYIFIGFIYNEFDESKVALKYKILAYKHSFTDEAKIESILEIIYTYFYMNNEEQIEEWADKLKKLYEKKDDIAGFYNEMATAYEVFYKPDKSLKYIDKLIEIKRQNPDKKIRGLIAERYIRLAEDYYKQNNMEMAMEIYNKTLKYIDKKDNERLSNIYMNIGLCVYGSRRYIESIEYFEKAEKVCNKNSSLYNKIQFYLGRGYYIKGDFHRAVECLERIYGKDLEPYFYYNTVSYLAMSYFEGDIRYSYKPISRRTLNLLRKAKELIEKDEGYNDINNREIILTQLACSEYLNGNRQEAERLFKLIAEDDKIDEYLKDEALVYKYVCYSRKGEVEKAIKGAEELASKTQYATIKEWADKFINEFKN